jgi:hypothetical protein
MFPLTFVLDCLCSQRLYVPLTLALYLHSISFVLTFGLTHRVCTFPLAFVNTSQDWLILQISLASLRVAHMASHWRMIFDAAKLTLPLSEGVILSHTKLASQLHKLSQDQRLGQDISYLLACRYVL